MAGPGSGPVGPGSEDVAAVPHAVLRSWDEAEARLFPTIMARPDVYQQAVSLIEQLLGRLRETCPACWRRTNAAATWSTSWPRERTPASSLAWWQRPRARCATGNWWRRSPPRAGWPR